MIYECPQCQAPQEAGRTVCPHCHAQFDAPVPSDAFVPPDDPAQPAESIAVEAGAAPATPPLQEALPPEEAPHLEEVKPPPAADPLPYLTPPSYSPSAYSPPPYTPAAAPPPMRPPLGGLSRALLIVFPIVLVLVLGSVYFVSTLSTGQDIAPVAPVVQAPATMPPPPAPVGSPTYLQGGPNTTSAGNDPRTKMLVGRWQAKSGDYYVFNGDGTGSRGSGANQQNSQSFLWGLVQNRLMLYRDKNEMLRFNPGPDDDTIYLGAETGHYVQYARDKT